MKTLVVGDLHGRWEVVEKVLKTDYNVVFVGDYLNSFDKTSLECLETLKLVTGAARDNPDKYTALMGNHELSYTGSEYTCSGYSRKTAYDLE